MNDVEIVDDDHYKISVKESDHLYRLDIDNVGEDHCGKIKVVAKNENGEDSKEVRTMFKSFLLFKLCYNYFNRTANTKYHIACQTFAFLFTISIL